MNELTTTPTETNPLALLQTAVERGLDPDQLGKLMDLQERWERNLALKAYAESLNAVQRELPAIIKDAVNPHNRSRYAKLETIQNVAKPIYTSHGFSISWSEGPPQREGWQHVILKVRHAGGHVEE